MQNRMDNIFRELSVLFLKKFEDYGAADIEKMGLRGVLTRAGDKLSRLENLYEKGKTAQNEPIRDSWLDLMGYAMIGLMLQDGVWPSSGTPSEVTGAPSLHGDTRESPTILLKRSEGILGILPPAKDGDVGYDLVAAEDYIVPPFGRPPVSVPCGFAVKLPEGYWAEIRPRSSTATKLGILVHQSVMDTGYVGPWFVVCHSIIGEDVRITKGTKIAQCIIHKSVVPELVETDSLPETERGSSGFGSSGLKV